MQYQDKIAMTGAAAIFAVLILFAALGVLPGSAHAQGRYGNSEVDAKQVKTVNAAQRGVVEAVLPAEIGASARVEDRTFGAVLGGALGALAARKGGWAAQAAAGTVAAWGGERIASAFGASRSDATEVVVRLEGGQLITVVQQVTGMPLGVGDAVYFVQNNGTARVVRAGTPATAFRPPIVQAKFHEQ